VKHLKTKQILQTRWVSRAYICKKEKTAFFQAWRSPAVSIAPQRPDHGQNQHSWRAENQRWTAVVINRLGVGGDCGPQSLNCGKLRCQRCQWCQQHRQPQTKPPESVPCSTGPATRCLWNQVPYSALPAMITSRYKACPKRRRLLLSWATHTKCRCGLFRTQDRMS
jgi:hypothetical protein